MGENRSFDNLLGHPYTPDSPPAGGSFEGREGRKPSARERDQIMGSFTPEMLPVLSTLAREFGVYDNWHAAVPSQTFCNRSFFHASTSHGFVTNLGGEGYRKWLNAAPTPTVFNRLEEAGLTWKIYFDEMQLVSFTGFIHARSFASTGTPSISRLCASFTRT
ncbi:alkaline phosphatase family protein [Leucobacter coleopterorum]|uniref:alkaline phosphatase family protein n=1 Tax=Leucobacter coleopterorum TaxID=2714933 RepID=UPI00244E3BBA|nr:alkaline phosphatase family protein [Leucobacter coleopterorum]